MSFLAQRDTTSIELMDDPNCDSEKLIRTYQQFRSINRYFSGWRHIYTQYIRPLCEQNKKPTRLLDVGCGGGDISLSLHAWAKADGFDLEITAIDPDPRAIDYFQSISPPEDISIACRFLAELVAEGQSFDVVISNHVLHHLTMDELQGLVTDSMTLAQKMVIHSDLRRDRFAYWAFACLTPFYRNSFIIPDGLCSIGRSFRPEELIDVLGAENGWKVIKRPFGHQLALWHKGSA